MSRMFVLPGERRAGIVHLDRFSYKQDYHDDAEIKKDDYGREWEVWADRVRTALFDSPYRKEYRLLIFEGFEVLYVAKVLGEKYNFPLDILVHLEANYETRVENLMRRPDKAARAQNNPEVFLRDNVQGYDFPVTYDAVIDNSFYNRLPLDTRVDIISQDAGLQVPAYMHAIYTNPLFVEYAIAGYHEAMECLAQALNLDDIRFFPDMATPALRSWKLKVLVTQGIIPDMFLAAPRERFGVKIYSVVRYPTEFKISQIEDADAWVGEVVADGQAIQSGSSPVFILENKKTVSNDIESLRFSSKIRESSSPSVAGGDYLSAAATPSLRDTLKRFLRTVVLVTLITAITFTSFPARAAQFSTKVDPVSGNQVVSVLVESGDTVDEIAKTASERAGEPVTRDEIVRANNLSVHSNDIVNVKIQAGQTLSIPLEKSGMAREEGGYYHTVVKGENIDTIARASGTSWQEVVKANPWLKAEQRIFSKHHRGKEITVINIKPDEHIWIPVAPGADISVKEAVVPEVTALKPSLVTPSESASQTTSDEQKMQALIEELTELALNPPEEKNTQEPMDALQQELEKLRVQSSFVPSLQPEADKTIVEPLAIDPSTLSKVFSLAEPPLSELRLEDLFLSPSEDSRGFPFIVVEPVSSLPQEVSKPFSELNNADNFDHSAILSDKDYSQYKFDSPMSFMQIEDLNEQLKPAPTVQLISSLPVGNEAPQSKVVILFVLLSAFLAACCMATVVLLNSKRKKPVEDVIPNAEKKEKDGAERQGRSSSWNKAAPIMLAPEKIKPLPPQDLFDSGSLPLSLGNDNEREQIENLPRPFFLGFLDGPDEQPVFIDGGSEESIKPDNVNDDEDNKGDEEIPSILLLDPRVDSLSRCSLTRAISNKTKRAISIDQIVAEMLPFLSADAFHPHKTGGIKLSEFLKAMAQLASAEKIHYYRYDIGIKRINGSSLWFAHVWKPALAKRGYQRLDMIELESIHEDDYVGEYRTEPNGFSTSSPVTPKEHSPFVPLAEHQAQSDTPESNLARFVFAFERGEYCIVGFNDFVMRSRQQLSLSWVKQLLNSLRGFLAHAPPECAEVIVTLDPSALTLPRETSLRYVVMYVSDRLTIYAHPLFFGLDKDIQQQLLHTATLQTISSSPVFILENKKTVSNDIESLRFSSKIRESSSPSVAGGDYLSAAATPSLRDTLFFKANGVPLASSPTEAVLTPAQERHNLLISIQNIFKLGENLALSFEEIEEAIVVDTTNDTYRMFRGLPVVIALRGDVFKNCPLDRKPLLMVFCGRGIISDEGLIYHPRSKGLVLEGSRLANSMEIKNALWEIPYHGKKTTFLLQDKDAWVGMPVLYGPQDIFDRGLLMGKGGDRIARLGPTLKHAEGEKEEERIFVEYTKGMVAARLLGFSIIDGPDMMRNVDHKMGLMVQAAWETVDDLNAHAESLAITPINKQEFLKVTTSNPSSDGGFSHTQWTVTSRGVVQGTVTTLRWLLNALQHPRDYQPSVIAFIKSLGIDFNDISCIIQGYGDVGSGIAKLLYTSFKGFNITVRGISNVHFALYRQDGLTEAFLRKTREIAEQDPDSFDIPMLLSFQPELLMSLRGGMIWIAQKFDPQTVVYLTAFFEGYGVVVYFGDPQIVNELIYQPATIFFPAAGPNIINDPSQISRLRCSIIGEGANNAIEQGLQSELRKAGIHYLPGELLNGGGIYTSKEDIRHNHVDGQEAIVHGPGYYQTHVTDEIDTLVLNRTLAVLNQWTRDEDSFAVELVDYVRDVAQKIFARADQLVRTEDAHLAELVGIDHVRTAGKLALRHSVYETAVEIAPLGILFEAGDESKAFLDIIDLADCIGEIREDMNFMNFTMCRMRNALFVLTKMRDALTYSQRIQLVDFLFRVVPDTSLDPLLRKEAAVCLASAIKWEHAAEHADIVRAVRMFRHIMTDTDETLRMHVTAKYALYRIFGVGRLEEARNGNILSELPKEISSPVQKLNGDYRIPDLSLLPDLRDKLIIWDLDFTIGFREEGTRIIFLREGIPDALHILRKLGARNILATSGDYGHAMRILTESDLDHFFFDDVSKRYLVFTGKKIKRKNNSGEEQEAEEVFDEERIIYDERFDREKRYRKIFLQLGYAPETAYQNTIVIGDKPFLDIAADVVSDYEGPVFINVPVLRKKTNSNYAFDIKQDASGAIGQEIVEVIIALADKGQGDFSRGFKMVCDESFALSSENGFVWQYTTPMITCQLAYQHIRTGLYVPVVEHIEKNEDNAQEPDDARLRVLYGWRSLKIIKAWFKNALLHRFNYSSADVSAAFRAIEHSLAFGKEHFAQGAVVNKPIVIPGEPETTVFTVELPFASNVHIVRYVIDGEIRYSLIDTGPNIYFTQLKELLASGRIGGQQIVPQQVDQILLTHADFDHAGAAHRFAVDHGVLVRAHRYCSEVVMNRAPHDPLGSLYTDYLNGIYGLELLCCGDFVKFGYTKRTCSLGQGEATLRFRILEELQLGNMPLLVLENIGVTNGWGRGSHTKDTVYYYDPLHGVLFTGHAASFNIIQEKIRNLRKDWQYDFLKRLWWLHGGSSNADDETLMQEEKAIRSMSRLVVFPAHGFPYRVECASSPVNSAVFDNLAKSQLWQQDVALWLGNGIASAIKKHSAAETLVAIKYFGQMHDDGLQAELDKGAVNNVGNNHLEQVIVFALGEQLAHGHSRIRVIVAQRRHIMNVLSRQYFGGKEEKIWFDLIVNFTVVNGSQLIELEKMRINLEEPAFLAAAQPFFAENTLIGQMRSSLREEALITLHKLFINADLSGAYIRFRIDELSDLLRYEDLFNGVISDKDASGFVASLMAVRSLVGDIGIAEIDDPQGFYDQLASRSGKPVRRISLIRNIWYSLIGFGIVRVKLDKLCRFDVTRRVGAYTQSAQELAALRQSRMDLQVKIQEEEAKRQQLQAQLAQAEAQQTSGAGESLITSYEQQIEERRLKMQQLALAAENLRKQNAEGQRMLSEAHERLPASIKELVDKIKQSQQTLLGFERQLGSDEKTNAELRRRIVNIKELIARQQEQLIALEAAPDVRALQERMRAIQQDSARLAREWEGIQKEHAEVQDEISQLQQRIKQAEERSRHYERLITQLKSAIAKDAETIDGLYTQLAQLQQHEQRAVDMHAPLEHDTALHAYAQIIAELAAIARKRESLGGKQRIVDIRRKAKGLTGAQRLPDDEARILAEYDQLIQREKELSQECRDKFETRVDKVIGELDQFSGDQERLKQFLVGLSSDFSGTLTQDVAAITAKMNVLFDVSGMPRPEVRYDPQQDKQAAFAYAGQLLKRIADKNNFLAVGRIGSSGSSPIMPLDSVGNRNAVAVINAYLAHQIELAKNANTQRAEHKNRLRLERAETRRLTSVMLVEAQAARQAVRFVSSFGDEVVISKEAQERFTQGQASSSPVDSYLPRKSEARLKSMYEKLFAAYIHAFVVLVKAHYQEEKPSVALLLTYTDDAARTLRKVSYALEAFDRKHVHDKLDLIRHQVRSRNIPAALATMRGLLNHVATLRQRALDARIKKQIVGDRVSRSSDGKIQVWHGALFMDRDEQTYQIRKDKVSFSTFWEASSFIDHQITSELNDRDKNLVLLGLVAGMLPSAVTHEIPAPETIAAQGAKILKSLRLAKAEEKVIARTAVLAAVELLQLPLHDKHKDHVFFLLRLAQGFIAARAQNNCSIVRALQDNFIGQLREKVVHEVNSIEVSVQAAHELLKQRRYKALCAHISDHTKHEPILREPEFEGALHILGRVQSVLSLRGPPRGLIAWYFDFILRKIALSRLIFSFMQLLRDTFIEAELLLTIHDGAALSERVEDFPAVYARHFLSTFQQFISRHPKMQDSIHYWWLRFQQAAFIPLKITEGSASKKKRIPNPVFLALQVLAKIEELRDLNRIMEAFAGYKRRFIQLHEYLQNAFGFETRSETTLKELIEVLSQEYKLTPEERGQFEQAALAAEQARNVSSPVKQNHHPRNQKQQTRDTFRDILTLVPWAVSALGTFLFITFSMPSISEHGFAPIDWIVFVCAWCGPAVLLLHQLRAWIKAQVSHRQEAKAKAISNSDVVSRKERQAQARAERKAIKEQIAAAQDLLRQAKRELAAEQKRSRQAEALRQAQEAVNRHRAHEQFKQSVDALAGVISLTYNPESTAAWRSDIAIKAAVFAARARENSIRIEAFTRQAAAVRNEQKRMQRLDQMTQVKIVLADFLLRKEAALNESVRLALREYIVSGDFVRAHQLVAQARAQGLALELTQLFENEIKSAEQLSEWIRRGDVALAVVLYRDMMEHSPLLFAARYYRRLLQTLSPANLAKIKRIDARLSHSKLSKRKDNSTATSSPIFGYKEAVLGALVRTLSSSAAQQVRYSYKFNSVSATRLLTAVALVVISWLPVYAQQAQSTQPTIKQKIEITQTNKAGIQALIAHLGADNDDLSRDAFHQLVAVGKPAVGELLKALVDQGNKENYDMRASIMWILGLIKDARAVPVIQKIMLEQPQNIQKGTPQESGIRLVRKAAAESLGLIGDPGAVEALLKSLSDKDELIRMMSCISLGQIGDARAMESLEKLSKDDPVEDVRLSAQGALDEIRSNKERQGEQSTLIHKHIHGTSSPVVSAFDERYFARARALFGETVMMSLLDLNSKFQGRCEEARWNLIEEQLTPDASRMGRISAGEIVKEVIVVSTTRCTRACLFCVSNSSMHGDVFVDPGALNQLLRELNKRSFNRPRVLLTGGESLAHPQIMELIEHNGEFIAGLFTNADFAESKENAAAVVKELERRMGRWGWEKGRFQFNISLDSMHGQGALEKVINLIEAIRAYFPEAGIFLSCQRSDQDQSGHNGLLKELFDRIAPDRQQGSHAVGGVILCDEQRNVTSKETIPSVKTFSLKDLDMWGRDAEYIDWEIAVRHYPLIFQNRGFLLLGSAGFQPDAYEPAPTVEEVATLLKPKERGHLYISPDGIIAPLDIMLDNPQPIRLATLADPHAAEVIEMRMSFDPLVRALFEQDGPGRIVRFSAEFDPHFTQQLIQTPLFMRDASIDDRAVSLDMSLPQIMYWIALNPERRFYITLRLLGMSAEAARSVGSERALQERIIAQANQFAALVSDCRHDINSKHISGILAFAEFDHMERKQKSEDETVLHQLARIIAHSVMYIPSSRHEIVNLREAREVINACGCLAQELEDWLEAYGLEDIVESLKISAEFRAVNIDRIDYGIIKTRRMVEDLLFGLRGAVVELRLAETDINTLIVNELAKIDIRSEVSLDQELPRLHIDWVLIANALHNLFANAQHAMLGRPGSLLCVSTKRTDSVATITVQDNGPGIPVDFRPFVFQRYFSTKGDQGTGLGLDIVRRTVQRHGGRIYLDQEQETGAKFVITLPFHPHASSPAHAKADDFPLYHLTLNSHQPSGTRWSRLHYFETYLPILAALLSSENRNVRLNYSISYTLSEELERYTAALIEIVGTHDANDFSYKKKQETIEGLFARQNIDRDIVLILKPVAQWTLDDVRYAYAACKELPISYKKQWPAFARMWDSEWLEGGFLKRDRKSLTKNDREKAKALLIGHNLVHINRPVFVLNGRIMLSGIAVTNPQSGKIKKPVIFSGDVTSDEGVEYFERFIDFSRFFMIDELVSFAVDDGRCAELVYEMAKAMAIFPNLVALLSISNDLEAADQQRDNLYDVLRQRHPKAYGALHKWERGMVDVSVTPHIISGALADQRQSARENGIDSIYVHDFTRPQDVESQLILAKEHCFDRFGQVMRWIWNAEGNMDGNFARLLTRQGIMMGFVGKEHFARIRQWNGELPVNEMQPLRFPTEHGNFIICPYSFQHRYVDFVGGAYRTGRI
ncbi:MAG: HEAT repeat domain-containing protein, partial [Candidatus Omnitrophica bacterium]|nr:HEAT repeat domain-containing protein [Candidatus Omnitrophota bacterium]